MIEEALRIRRKVFGDEDPIVAKSLNNLAVVCLTEVGLLSQPVFC